MPRKTFRPLSPEKATRADTRAVCQGEEPECSRRIHSNESHQHQCHVSRCSCRARTTSASTIRLSASAPVCGSTAARTTRRSDRFGEPPGRDQVRRVGHQQRRTRRTRRQHRRRRPLEVSGLLTAPWLITNSANEAGLSKAEKEANQLQIDSILQTIDRVADQTSFRAPSS